MKKIALISAIALSGLFYNSANAQIRLGFGIHINTPAVRIVAETAPPVYTDYSAADDYYYLPEVDAYYSVPERAYYYNNGYNWVSAAYLPGEYRNYDWRNARHYEVRARRPYLNADVYRDRYKGRANDWGRYNDRQSDNRAYANRDNRDDRRSNQPVFERRNDNRGAEHAEGRGGWNNGNRAEQRDNRPQGNYNQPAQPQRGQGGNSQPAQQPRNGGRGRGNNQPQQNQPSRGDGGHQRGGSSDDHFADNHGQSNRGEFKS